MLKFVLIICLLITANISFSWPGIGVWKSAPQIDNLKCSPLGLVMGIKRYGPDLWLDLYGIKYTCQNAKGDQLSYDLGTLFFKIKDQIVYLHPDGQKAGTISDTHLYVDLPKRGIYFKLDLDDKGNIIYQDSNTIKNTVLPTTSFIKAKPGFIIIQ